jgi:glycosyltransferase involved in cell wall biosynthesis
MKFSQSATPTILCLSHLGWDNVWQRPQQILSRLAAHYPVIYVNEPYVLNPSHASYPADGQAYLRPVNSKGNVTAWQPIFPDLPELLASWRETYVRLVRMLLPRWGGNGYRSGSSGGAPSTHSPLILWFYTPMPYYFLDHFPADLVIYDVMDELANFKGAAKDMREREAKLLARADVVFTGGRSMYQARREQHPNLHLFASGVEPAHFARALEPATPVAAEISALYQNGHQPTAVLGYYGVIDERIDLELLHTLAASHSEWAIFMVGPVAKIDTADLPRLPNIHYTGQQPYERLPHFLKGFDVCLMPFAQNEATRCISPTKTLEYMAAHKPIVSTPIPDVVANWGHMVHLAADAVCFATAVSTALKETKRQQAARAKRENALLACHTWDYIVAQMHGHMKAGLAQKQAKSEQLATDAAAASRQQFKVKWLAG